MQTQKSPKLMKSTKKRKNNIYRTHGCMLQVEHGIFTPLVMSATGGMNRECKKFYSRLAEMICKRRKTNYNVAITRIRRKIAFSLIKSIGICLRRSCSVFQNGNLEMSLNGATYTSEFQSSLQIDKITYDARRRSKISIFCNDNDNREIVKC